MTGHERQPRTDRQEFMATAGFALYADVNDTVLERLAREPLQQATGNPSFEPYEIIPRHHFNFIRQNPAGASLYVAMKTLTHALPDSSGTFNDDHHVNSEDLYRAKPHTFGYGFEDLDFPWYFPTIAADTVACFFVEQGTITQEQKDALTLTDWAGMIGTRWFSHLMHQMALTNNGVYETLGKTPDSYFEGALKDRLGTMLALPSDARPPLFDLHARLNPQDGMVHASASLSQAHVQPLRSRMHKMPGGSVGCPAARYTTMLPRHLVETDPHVQSLLQRGQLVVIPERSNEQEVRVVQSATAIDKSLALFSKLLTAYDTQFGTPHVRLSAVFGIGDASFEHHHAPPLDALRRQPPAAPLASVVSVEEVCPAKHPATAEADR